MCLEGVQNKATWMNDFMNSFYEFSEYLKPTDKVFNSSYYNGTKLKRVLNK